MIFQLIGEKKMCKLFTGRKYLIATLRHLRVTAVLLSCLEAIPSEINCLSANSAVAVDPILASRHEASAEWLCRTKKANFVTDTFFLSGSFHLVFLDFSWSWVVEEKLPSGPMESIVCPLSASALPPTRPGHSTPPSAPRWSSVGRPPGGRNKVGCLRSTAGMET